MRSLNQRQLDTVTTRDALEHLMVINHETRL